MKKWASTPNKYTVIEAQKQKPHGMSHYMHYVNWMVLSPPPSGKIKTCIRKLDGIVPSSVKNVGLPCAQSGSAVDPFKQN